MEVVPDLTVVGSVPLLGPVPFEARTLWGWRHIETVRRWRQIVRSELDALAKVVTGGAVLWCWRNTYRYLATEGFLRGERYRSVVALEGELSPCIGVAVEVEADAGELRVRHSLWGWRHGPVDGEHVVALEAIQEEPAAVK